MSSWSICTAALFASLFGSVLAQSPGSGLMGLDLGLVRPVSGYI